MTDNSINNNTNAFEASINRFSHSDVKGDIRKEKRAMIPTLIVHSLLIAICIGLFGYAVFMLASNAIESGEVSELYDSVRPESLTSAVKPSSTLLEPNSMYTLQESLNSNGKQQNYVGDIDSVEGMTRRSSYYRNYMNFASKYPDAYGWVYVDYTQIDYPIMKGPYNDYYLYRNFMGKTSAGGCITAESNMSDDFDVNLNNVLYGHCMKNGSMFRSLKTFMESANRNTLGKSMNIEIYTEDGLYIYKILSGYRNDGASFASTSFSDEEEYEEFLETIVDRNTLGVSQKLKDDTRICTLITCANVTSNEDERYVLHGILTSFIPASQL